LKTDGLSPGVYFVRIEMKGLSDATKIMIE
jgi:hypothetical protein